MKSGVSLSHLTNVLVLSIFFLKVSSDVSCILEKSIKWTNNKLLKTNKGYDIIYQILRRFVKNTDTNWYDLKEKKDFIKKIIINKLT